VAVFTLPVAQYAEVTPRTVLVTAVYPRTNADIVRLACLPRDVV
jgi:hypothetical protein